MWSTSTQHTYYLPRDALSRSFAAHRAIYIYQLHKDINLANKQGFFFYMFVQHISHPKRKQSKCHNELRATCTIEKALYGKKKTNYYTKDTSAHMGDDGNVDSPYKVANNNMLYRRVISI